MGEADEIVDKYVEIVDKIIGFIPYKRMKTWKEFFFSPAKVVKSNIDSYTDRIKDIYVFTIIDFIIGLIAAIPAFIAVGIGALGVPLLGLGVGAGIALGLAIAVVIIIITPLFYLLYAGLEYIVAKILGGKADFRTHFNASILPSLAVYVIGLPLSILAIPVQWISYVPVLNLCTCIIGAVITIASILLGLYGLYLRYLAFKEVHSLSMWRSIGVVFIPIVLLLIVIAIIAFLFYAAMLAALLGGAAVGSLLQSY